MIVNSLKCYSLISFQSFIFFVVISSSLAQSPDNQYRYSKEVASADDPLVVKSHHDPARPSRQEVKDAIRVLQKYVDTDSSAAAASLVPTYEVEAVPAVKSSFKSAKKVNREQSRTLAGRSMSNEVEDSLSPELESDKADDGYSYGPTKILKTRSAPSVAAPSEWMKSKEKPGETKEPEGKNDMLSMMIKFMAISHGVPMDVANNPTKLMNYLMMEVLKKSLNKRQSSPQSSPSPSPTPSAPTVKPLTLQDRASIVSPGPSATSPVVPSAKSVSIPAAATAPKTPAASSTSLINLLNSLRAKPAGTVVLNSGKPTAAAAALSAPHPAMPSLPAPGKLDLSG